MSELTNITDESSYLARDYSSIIRWFVKKLKYLTTEWTDLTVSEPDTMILSYVAYIFDLTNYLVDHKYIDTMFDETNSISYLSYLYKVIGSELLDYESGIFTANITNQSNNTIHINKLDILNMVEHTNQLFTCINDYDVQPKTSLDILLIRGTPINRRYRLPDIPLGFIVLPDININRNMVLVYVDGVTELERIDNAVFSDTPGFEVKQYSNKYTSIKLSPSAYRMINDNLVIIYNINSTEPVIEDSELSLLKDISDDYDIYTVTNNSFNNITLRDIKHNYLEELYKINSLYNERFDVSDFKVGRIDFINYRYMSNYLFKEGTIDYETGELVFSLIQLSADNIAHITYRYSDESGESRIDSSIELPLSLENTINLEIPEGYSLEPMSLVIKYDTDIINDPQGNGILEIIHSKSKIVFSYSTSDDNPIDELIQSGEIDYDHASISMIFNYIPSGETIISYAIDTGGEITYQKEYFNISDIDTFIALNVNTMVSSIIPNSVVITNGLNIVKDNDGVLYNESSDKSVLLNLISDKILINHTLDDIVLNKLQIKYINIKSTVYLYSTDISTDTVLSDINDALIKNFKKGTHVPGESIKRLPIILTIENSNSSIKYITLDLPTLDVSVDSNQISDLGTVDIVFERSDT